MTQPSDECQESLRELGDPEFFRRWAKLRHLIAVGGKSVPGDLRREYEAASGEYRRRIGGE
jgi:hypothetical protein